MNFMEKIHPFFLDLINKKEVKNEMNTPKGYFLPATAMPPDICDNDNDLCLSPLILMGISIIPFKKNGDTAYLNFKKVFDKTVKTFDELTQRDFDALGMSFTVRINYESDLLPIYGNTLAALFLPLLSDDKIIFKAKNKVPLFWKKEKERIIKMSPTHILKDKTDDGNYSMYTICNEYAFQPKYVK